MFSVPHPYRERQQFFWVWQTQLRGRKSRHVHWRRSSTILSSSSTPSGWTASVGTTSTPPVRREKEIGFGARIERDTIDSSRKSHFWLGYFLLKYIWAPYLVDSDSCVFFGVDPTVRFGLSEQLRLESEDEAVTHLRTKLRTHCLLNNCSWHHHLVGRTDEKIGFFYLADGRNRSG